MIFKKIYESSDKDGTRSMKKKLGNMFNGPFRKGDRVEMTGDNGETVQGTITSFDYSDRTYTVLLGNHYNESVEDRSSEILEILSTEFTDVYPDDYEIADALVIDVDSVKIDDEGIYDGKDDGGYIKYRDYSVEYHGGTYSVKFCYDDDTLEVGDFEVKLMF